MFEYKRRGHVLEAAWSTIEKFYARFSYENLYDTFGPTHNIVNVV